jgi:hypothetical protein
MLILALLLLLLLLLLQEYGAVLDVEAAPDVVGLVTPEHGGTADLPGECYIDI